MNTYRLGPYLLLKRLGCGGMAETWLAARQISTEIIKYYALKCILSPYNAVADYVRLFYHEAGVSLMLDHPNLVSTWDCTIIDGRHVMVMEWMEGATLDALLARAPGRTLPPEAASYIALEILDGLGYLHDLCHRDGTPMNIIHRDVNPKNIFIFYDGRCKLFDFGVARTGGESDDIQHGMLVGTPAYMSPELCLGNPIDARSDLFSMAAVLYEMCMGRPAFEGDNDIRTINSIVTHQPEAPAARNIQFPSFLSRIVMRGLEKLPENRYESASAFAHDLQMFRKVAGFTKGKSLLKNWMSSLFANEIAQGDRYLAQVTQTLSPRAPTMNALIAASRQVDSFAEVSPSLQVAISKLPFGG